MRAIFNISILLIMISSCKGQTVSKNSRIVGGPCEGCEAIFEYGDRTLSSIDTLPDFGKINPPIKITGRVFKSDQRTPAKDVILYIYHTNRNGIYDSENEILPWGKRHGYLRGWVKTSLDGKYTFYTFRPAAYPDDSEPEHVHLTIKEPNINEYYADSFFFDDDPLLTQSIISSLKNRCGSGITTPKMINGILTIERDLILGLNIPNY